MKKIVLLVLFVCALLLCFTACAQTPDATTTTTTTSTTTTASCAHEFSEWVILKDSSCAEEGMQMRVCELCNFGEYKAISKFGHTEVTLQAVAPTCTETGLSEGKYCSVCNTTLVAQETVGAKGHTEVTLQAVAPTCTTPGKTEGKYCSVCKTVLVPQNEIPGGHIDEDKNHKCDRCEDIMYTQGLELGLIDDHYVVGGVTAACTDVDILIPPTYNGLPVTEIWMSAWWCSISIQSITIPETITLIKEEWSLNSCRKVENIYVHKDNTHFKSVDGVLYTIDGKSLVQYPVGRTQTSYAVLDGVTNIDMYAFECSVLKNITIPSTMTSISDRAFNYCFALEKIEIPTSVTSIGACAFASCHALESIVIPSSIINIGDAAFSNCTSLTSVVIGNSVTSIGDQAFRGCTNLTSVEIPDSVTSIGYGTFYECTSLTSVVIGDSVTSIGDHAFEGCYSLTFNEYGNCRYLGNASNPYVALIGVTSQNLSSYDIHYDTRVIADRAFDSCSRLASVVIPDSVTSIGDWAFAYCTSLISVVIGNSVTSIEDYAFYWCSSLTSVVIGDSVTSIERYAFSSCTSLSDVYYTGTAEQWQQISIGSDNYDLTSATRHYNYAP